MKKQNANERIVGRGPRAVTLCSVLVLVEACKPGEVEEIIIGDTDGNVTAPSAEESGGWNGCLERGEPGKSAIRHQCGGYGFPGITFTIVGAGDANGTYPLLSFYQFGAEIASDSYESPKVMACCDPPYDEDADEALDESGSNFESTFVFQPHYDSCLKDMVQQACISFYTQLADLAADPKLPKVARPQVRNLRDWVGAHQQECYDQFYKESGAQDFIPTDGFDVFEINHTWKLGDSAETLNIKGIEVSLTQTQVRTIDLPDNPDEWLSCESLTDNDGATFGVVGDEPDDLVSGSAHLEGPDYGGGTVSGTLSFAGADNGCSLCSSIAVAATPNAVALESLILESAAAGVIGDGDANAVTAEHVRIATVSSHDATMVAPGTYQLAVGSVVFVVGGRVDGESDIVTASNVSPIMMRRSGNAWVMDPFAISYADAWGGTWTLTTSPLVFEAAP